VGLEGTLRVFSLTDIFQMLGLQRKTGVLTVEGEDDTITISFLGGQVVAAESEARRLENRLGNLLHIEGNFCGPSVYRYGRGHWRQDRDEGPAGGMTGRGVHVVDAMLYLAGQIGEVYAQSFRLAQDFGIDDTTSMLFRFRGGASGYLGTVIASAETWRMQVFGSKGWVEVGDVEHLTTWDMRVCLLDPAMPAGALAGLIVSRRAMST